MPRIRFDEASLAKDERDREEGQYATQRIREIETPYIYGEEDGAERVEAAGGSSSGATASAAVVNVKLSAKEGGRYAIDADDLQERLRTLEAAQRRGVDITGDAVADEKSRTLRRADLDEFARRKRAFYRDEANDGAIRHRGEGMWIQLASRTTGDLFWCHTGTKAVQWERPEGVEDDVAAAEAPPTAAAAVDADFLKSAFDAMAVLRKDAKKSRKKRSKLRAGLKNDFGDDASTMLAAWKAEHQASLFPVAAASPAPALPTADAT